MDDRVKEASRRERLTAAERAAEDAAILQVQRELRQSRERQARW